MNARLQSRTLLPFYLAAGALALTAQTVLLRELMVSLQGDEAAVGLGLAAWLAGIALGALTARSLGAGFRWTGLGLGLLALAAPAAVIVARVGRAILAPSPGELFSLGPSVALALVVLVPPGFLVGSTFTALASHAARTDWAAGDRIARVYVMEAAGALLAGLVVTFVVLPLLSPITGLCGAAALWVLLGTPAAWSGAASGRVLLPVVVAVLVVTSLPAVSRRLEDATQRARFQGVVPGMTLVEWDDTPYQHAAIAGESPRHVYSSGQYAGSFPDPVEHETMAHKLASLSPDPGRVLIVGDAAPALMGFLLRHPIERIDHVRMDARALALLRRWLPQEDREVLDDPRVRVIVDDPRRHLARERERYGLVLVLEPAPVTLLLSRLATVEFYGLCAGALAPDGVVVVPLETGPNVLSEETRALGGSLYGALRRVFPVVRASPGPDALLVAGHSDRAVTLDPAVLAARYENRHIASQVFVPQTFSYLFPPERVESQERVLAAAAREVAPSTDRRPVSFLHALAVRQNIAGSVLGPVLGRISRIHPVTLFIVSLLPALCVLAAVSLTRDRTTRGALATLFGVAATGGCGMTLSLLLLFSYQTRAGALFGRIGALSALFMLGLAVGAYTSSRLALRAGIDTRRLFVRSLAVALGLAIVAVAALRILGTEGAAGSPGLFHGVLLVLSGAATGAPFPVAATLLLGEGWQARGAGGALEAADHGGAAIAALLAGVLLVPALGLLGAAWLVVGVEAAAVGAAAIATRTR